MATFGAISSDNEFNLGDLDLPRTGVGTNTTVSTPRQVVGCTANSITVTLATALLGTGVWVAIKDESGSAGNVGDAITVDTEGSETIDGSASFALNENYGSVLIYSDGTNWFTLAGVGTIL